MWAPFLLVCGPPIGLVFLPSANAIQLPIAATLARRGTAGAAGLGDYLDVSYNVMVNIGGAFVPLLLDTGSSDLWVLSDLCTKGCGTNVPAYRQQTNFNSTGLDASLLYGDSATGTFARGLIGNDNVSVAGLQVSNQTFAAINKTNVGLIKTGSSGILGLGFPANRLARLVFFNLARFSLPAGADTTTNEPQKRSRSIFTTNFNFLQPHFPNLRFPKEAPHTSQQHSYRETRSISDLVFDSYSDIAPFPGRLIATNQIDGPLFSVTLQRDTIDVGGNSGQFSVGELPLGVENGSLTWVPVRRYSEAEGGLSGPSDAPYETYPLSWEIIFEDVYLDGELLPRSNLSSSDIQLSALIDTGNSLIRGPEDIISEIQNRIGTAFPCSEAHTLSFLISGKQFPVDPRDLIYQHEPGSIALCSLNMAVTDPPVKGGYLFSWSLGIPFLKGVVSSFYFGDLKYPSRDPPRVGFRSTVPEDANGKLIAAVEAAIVNNKTFPSESIFCASRI
ncbi:hypothetical protein AGABI2DRAFT_211096 [Agaricus bisporus var. bisporus H97]|uniref:hypothetical protein n=1 Tax=Agaricus bisporus var. bisporus (strain H97 / ATCC MYA-4626 / FGSC 10389) TaxID=936046 RepID=UPI00029F53C3|nr:hypothetical protein AGABI2DRAFT_211096 [Agaricus bisporus var. bisporus H97]EKV43241.1 hypothetical protein AGABI2DRAFT_211096 [Agaricus bisporus var. bisporus H97]